MSVEVRVAVASSDGKVINSHFGRATQFLIFDITGGKYKFVELRKAEAICIGGEHLDDALSQRFEILKDCEIVLASVIGYSLVAALTLKGITPLQGADFIDDALEKLASNNKLQLLKSKKLND